MPAGMGRHSSDVGLALLEQIYQDMHIDPDRCVRSDRRFTWWHWRLAQTVRASPPFESLGHTVTRITATTDFLCEISDIPRSRAVILSLNGLASMNAAVYDLEARKVRLGCSALFHAENAPWLLVLFRNAAIIQMAEACLLAEESAKTVGCLIDSSSPPGRAPSSEMDDLASIHHFLARVRAQSQPVDPNDAEAAVEKLRGLGFLSYSGRKSIGLSAEFPFFGKRTALESIVGDLTGLGGRKSSGNETALLTIDSEQSHPILGPGLLTLLQLPVNGDYADPFTQAFLIDLNQGGLVSENFLGHLLGAWCLHPRLMTVTCVSFLPLFLWRPGLLFMYCMNEYVKARWALGVYHAHHRSG